MPSLQRLMAEMGVKALYPKRNLSRRRQDHKVYPYLLRGLCIERPNQVWAADVTYIPMAKGFLYLVAIIDWYSRKVLSWRLSNTLDTEFCLEALEAALSVMGDRRYSIPTRVASLPVWVAPRIFWTHIWS